VLDCILAILAHFSAWNQKKYQTTDEEIFGIRLCIFLLAVILFRVINIQNYSFQNHLATHNELVLTAGFVIFLLGLFTAIWARVHLGKNWGMPMSTNKTWTSYIWSVSLYSSPNLHWDLTRNGGSSLASSFIWLTIFAIAGIYFVYSAIQEEK